MGKTLKQKSENLHENQEVISQEQIQDSIAIQEQPQEPILELGNVHTQDPIQELGNMYIQEQMQDMHNPNIAPAGGAPCVNSIVNTKVPLVVFVGPPASGKSMILVRLAQYLFKNGYRISPDTTFMATPEYANACAEFSTKLNTNIALEGTVKYLLVDVYDTAGRVVAKLLEAPGEDFYDSDPTTAIRNNNQLKPYLTTIMASANPKSYVVLLDLDSNLSFRTHNNHRLAYMGRFLNDFYPNINKENDQIVLLYNKIDKTQFGTIHGCPDEKIARDDAKIYYDAFFNTMKVSKLAGWLTVDNFTFQTFCTGIFADVWDNNGHKYQTYNVADDCYPKKLWKQLMKKW